MDETRYNALLRDLGNVPLVCIADRMEEYLRVLRNTPSLKTGKVLTNATLNRFLTMAKTALNLAVDLELLTKNPLLKARFPKLREVPRDRVLSEIEKQRLINTVATEAPHLLALTRYALRVPCRKSELINMRRGDLDLFHNSIRVQNGTTKNDQGCDKPIPEELREYFRNLPAGCDYLFYREHKGQYYPLGDFKKSWHRCLRLAGINSFRFHDTRHMAATALLDNGTPERVVMAVAGWKSDMLRTYYHRDGKKSLGLVRFDSGTVQKPDTVEVNQRQVC